MPGLKQKCKAAEDVRGETAQQKGCQGEEAYGQDYNP
jgi:hypothetical protein